MSSVDSKGNHPWEETWEDGHIWKATPAQRLFRYVRDGEPRVAPGSEADARRFRGGCRCKRLCISD